MYYVQLTLIVRDGFEYEGLSLIEENPMNKIFYFLMVSVAFTGLQVGTVEAADGPPTATQGFSGEHKPSADPRDTGIEGEFDPNYTEATDQRKDIGIAAGDVRVNTGTGGLEDKGRKYGTRGTDSMGGRGDLLEDSKFRHGREISKGDRVSEPTDHSMQVR